jgi:hypothetical protein
VRPRGPLACILLLLLGACGPADTGPIQAGLPDGPALLPSQEVAWRAELLAERARKDEEFRTSETSPMAGTQYLKSEPAERLFLKREGESFALAYKSSRDAVLSMTREEGAWRWQALVRDVTCRREGEAVTSGSSIDGPALFSVGELRLRFFPGEERVTFIVFDRQREEMVAFEHLLYFQPTPAFAVWAELVPFEEAEAIEVATSRNLKKTFFRYARIRFRIDGIDRELTALKSALEGEGSKEIFIPADRFFVLDFNRAFNPLCNYSPAYNCAVPPRENRLEVPILAGEKSYPH